MTSLEGKLRGAGPEVAAAAERLRALSEEVGLPVREVPASLRPRAARGPCRHGRGRRSRSWAATLMTMADRLRLDRRARRRLSSCSASRSSASVSMNSFTNIGCMMPSPVRRLYLCCLRRCRRVSPSGHLAGVPSQVIKGRKPAGQRQGLGAAPVGQRLRRSAAGRAG